MAGSAEFSIKDEKLVKSKIRPTRRGRKLALLGIFPVAWVLVMNLGPLLQMIRISFLTSYPPEIGTPPAFTLDNYVQFFTSSIFFVPLIRTIIFAVVVTACVLVTVYPVAYVIARKVRPDRRVRFLLLLMIPFWTSDIVRIFAFVVMLGNRGAINTALSFLGLTSEPIEFMYTYFSLATGTMYIVALYMLLPLYSAIEKIPNSVLEAASDLGAGPLSRFIRVTVPLTKDGIVSGCTFVFLICAGAYVAPILLGGPSTTLFSETIGTFFHVAGDRWPTGAAFSVIMLIVALAMAGMLAKLSGRTVKFSS